MENIRGARYLSGYWEKVFGVRVRGYRQALGWTQGELANQMSSAGWPMHQSTITKIEGGTRPSSVGEAAALAALFNIPMTQLFEPDDQVAAQTEIARLSSRVTRLQAEKETLSARMERLDAQIAEAGAEFLALLDQIEPLDRPAATDAD